ncbi:AzlD domain-containing protein [Haloimpatiens sp. FM7315]|uniref:AzlD domain-containing protein n=1 Tax=Haloimpatiens sp. FM7315 TaxID=3298609 RepID=UPI0035A28B8B
MMKMFIAVLLMALVTYLPRVLPLIFVKGNIKSKFIKSFLFYVPFAVLGAMTFPAIFYSTQNLPSAIAGTAVALFLAYLEKNLVTVAISAIVVVYAFGIVI